MVHCDSPLERVENRDNSKVSNALSTLARIKRETKILRYSPYPWQIDFHNSGKLYKDRMVIAGNRVGKAQPNSEPILTPDGFVKIGSLKVGDFVTGSDGRPTKVTGIFPQGPRDIYEITFSDKSKVRCDLEHLWCVRKVSKGRDSKFSTRPLSELKPLIDTGYRFAIPERPICEFSDRGELPLDPYLLGVLLGDGGLTGAGVRLTNIDDNIINYCKNIASDYACVFNKIGEQTYQFATMKRYPSGGHFNVLKDILTGLQVHGVLSKNKRVPGKYLYALPGERMQILKGLMDTDGYCSKNGARVFYSTSLGLCEDVQFLARSLGINASIGIKNGKYKGGRHVSYSVYISRSERSIFDTPRKKTNEVFTGYTARGLIIESVTKLGVEESVCISVDAEDQLYITNDFIITHNTYSAAAEVGFHVTGLYPSWWDGHRFDGPTSWWCCGVTNESLRDISQKELLGGIGDAFGTGMIPKERLGKPTTRMAGISGVVDGVKIAHVSGGFSEITWKSYEQGWQKFQGTAQDGIWLDEDPNDPKLFTECLTRLMTKHGLMITTFTPLLGVTPMLQHFYDMGDAVYIKNVTWDDAPHITEEDKRLMLEKYPEHERKTRSLGVPMRGEGVVFPFPEGDISCASFQVPRHWPQIIGIDFGYDHPAATVKLAFDPDNDIVYVVAADKERKMDALSHSEKIKRMGGEKFPVSWPHDGLNTEKGKGEQLISTYRQHGLNLLSISARHKNDVGGAQSRETGIMDIYERIKTGRFKVFSHLNEFFEEYRNYHRKDNKIVDRLDDIISATLYAYMMRRFAVPEYIANGDTIQNVPMERFL